MSDPPRPLELALVGIVAHSPRLAADHPDNVSGAKIVVYIVSPLHKLISNAILKITS